MIINNIQNLINESFNSKFNAGDLVPNHETIAIVIRKNNKFLSLYHNKFNFWIVPVGKIDPGDTAEETVKKEAKEELNINITKLKFVKSYINKYLRNGIDVTITSNMYEVISYTGTIKNNEPHKHRDLKFMTLEELNNQPVVPDAIKELTKIYK